MTTVTGHRFAEAWAGTFALAQYHAWMARKPNPCLPGADPMTGRPNPTTIGWIDRDRLTIKLHRAARIAMAREAYKIARRIRPSRLP